MLAVQEEAEVAGGRIVLELLWTLWAVDLLFLSGLIEYINYFGLGKAHISSPGSPPPLNDSPPPLLDRCILDPVLQYLFLGSQLQQDVGSSRSLVLVDRLPDGREGSADFLIDLPQRKTVYLLQVYNIYPLTVVQISLSLDRGRGVYL